MELLQAVLCDRKSSIDQVIWDWNGTLLDDLDLCVESIGHQLKRHGLSPVSSEVHRELFGFPIRQFYERLGFDLESHSYDDLARDFFEAYEPAVYARGRLFPGVRETLDGIRAGGIRQSILSAAGQEQLDQLVAHFGIAQYFDRIYGLGDSRATSKIARGHELIESLGVDPERVLLIGDTDHDIDVAEALGTQYLILGDGHQHPSVLRRRASADPMDRVLESRYEPGLLSEKSRHQSAAYASRLRT